MTGLLLLFPGIRGEGKRKNKKEMELTELFDNSIEYKGLGVKLGRPKPLEEFFPIILNMPSWLLMEKDLTF